VLLAGVAGISATRFTVAVAIGRGARYLALGLLAVKYGDRAIAYMRDNGAIVALAVAALLVAGFAGYLLWHNAQKAKGR
jgi:membrane protein DedA with SNARE-associated domain